MAEMRYAFMGSKSLRATVLNRAVILIKENGSFCIWMTIKSMRFHSGNTILFAIIFTAYFDILVSFLGFWVYAPIFKKLIYK